MKNKKRNPNITSNIKQGQPNAMDAPTVSVSKIEKNTLAVSTYIWIGLLVILCSIPLLNFVAIPFIAGFGILGFAIYSFVKMAKGRSASSRSRLNAINPDASEPVTSLIIVEPGRPGLTSVKPLSKSEQSRDQKVGH